MTIREKVEAALRDGKALPAGPAVMSKISELCRDPQASARDLGKLIQLDSALTTRVLKQVNSSFYGLKASIKTVTHAVVILGFQEIRHIALSVPAASLYQDHLDAPGIDVAALWESTLQTACLARAYSYHVKHPVPEQIFVGAILTNIGMVVLNDILAEEYATVVEKCPDDEFLPSVEEAELGISHIEVGRALAEKWHFPPDLIRTIACHHDPVADGEVVPEAGLVYAGRITSTGKFLARTAEQILADLAPVVVEEFDLTPAVIGQVIEKADSEVDAARAMLT